MDGAESPALFCAYKRSPLRRYLLPPIIFYAGLSVKKKQFFRNLGTIAAFGILGTYTAFALIALVLYGLAQLPNILNLSVRSQQQPTCQGGTRVANANSFRASFALAGFCPGSCLCCSCWGHMGRSGQM